MKIINLDFTLAAKNPSGTFPLPSVETKSQSHRESTKLFVPNIYNRAAFLRLFAGEFHSILSRLVACILHSIVITTRIMFLHHRPERGLTRHDEHSTPPFRKRLTNFNIYVRVCCALQRVLCLSSSLGEHLN